MVIQAIFLLDTLDKDVNSFSMRVRHVLVLHKHFMFLKLASLLSIKVSRLVILIVLLGDFLVTMLIHEHYTHVASIKCGNRIF